MNKLETINNEPCIVFDSYEEMQDFLETNRDYKQMLGNAVYRVGVEND